MWKSYLLFKLFHEYLNSQGISDDHIIEVALDDRTHTSYTNDVEIKNRLFK